jgi:hypothetical protein
MLNSMFKFLSSCFEILFIFNSKVVHDHVKKFLYRSWLLDFKI